MNIATTSGAQRVRVFYSDEHAMTLGARRVNVTTSSGANATDFPFSPMPNLQAPAAVTSPSIGASALTGDDAGTDPQGRLAFPAPFVTDITDDPLRCSPGHEAGCNDWQFGGAAQSPDAVFGTWKAAVRTVDETRAPVGVTLAGDADPAGNGSDFAGGDAAPSNVSFEAFGAELRWDVDNLGLEAGHSYRLYVLVHDGDHAADVGQACGVVSL